MFHPRSRITKVLVAWYGLFQTAHFFVNGAYLLSSGDLPFHPPPDGWLPQTVSFLNGMAAADFANCVLTWVFVVGYVRALPWAAWLGTLTLAVSIYAAIVFLWGTVAAGAPSLGMPYLWVNLPFVPVVGLFVAWCVWGANGQLWQVGAAQQVVRQPGGHPSQSG